MNRTSNYGFNIPELDDIYDVDNQNENFEALDTILATLSAGGNGGAAVGGIGLGGTVGLDGNIRFKHIPIDRNTKPSELATEILEEVPSCHSLNLNGYNMPLGTLLYTHENDIKDGKYTGVYLGGVAEQVITAWIMVDGVMQDNIFGVDYEGTTAYVKVAGVTNGFVFGFKYSGGGTGCPDWYCGTGTNLDTKEGCGFYCQKNSFYWCHGDKGSYVYEVADNGTAILPNDNKWLNASPIISTKGRVIADNIYAINSFPVASDVDIWNESDDVEEWNTFGISDAQGSYISGSRPVEESKPQLMMRI